MSGLKKLSVDEVISVLDGVTASGNGYKALCPSHNDKEPSLSISADNDGNAMCYCHAGCNQQTVFKAIYDRLGRQMEFDDDKPVRVKKEIIARNDYIDENGDIIDTKVRQQPKKFFWDKAVKKQKRKNELPLFNLKNVIEHDIIFAVEGEKDVLTLSDLGYGATNSKDGFTKGNMHFLSGKDVIVIPDNDSSGQKYAEKAAFLVKGTAKSVKILDLSKIWADMPQKADVTDYIKAGNTVEDILSYADTLEEYHQTPSETENKDHPHSRIWNEIEGYFLNEKNQISYMNGNTVIPLCHGSIIISEVIYNDDGMENEIFFKCEGMTESGDTLPTVTIPADEFDSLKWITKKWGCQIVTFGSQSANQRLVSGIKQTGTKAKITHQKCHTGYVDGPNGKPIAYLHANGSIGDSDILCDLPEELQQYSLSRCSVTREEQISAFKASLSFLDSHDMRVTYPLYAFTFAAPIMRIVRDAVGDMGLLAFFLRGLSQNGKSTLAGTATSHFGFFDPTTPPTSFESTWNRNELLSFLLKDCILWIDDFHPKGNRKQADEQREQFNSIARAAGDRAVRGRLDSNSDLKRSYKPRCLFLITGEDDPGITQSGIARIFTVDVKKSRKNIDDLRTAARNGTLSRAMSDYISYLIRNYDSSVEFFRSMYSQIYAQMKESLGEFRLTKQAALLMVSLSMFLKYALENNLISNDKAEEIYKNGEKNIIDVALENDEDINENDPAAKFIRYLIPMIANKEVFTIDIDGLTANDKDHYTLFNSERIGWHDRDFFYLEPNRVYEEMLKKLDKNDDSLGKTKKRLFHELLEKGYIIGSENGDPTIPKRIPGMGEKEVMRVLRFPRRTLVPYELPKITDVKPNEKIG